LGESTTFFFKRYIPVSHSVQGEAQRSRSISITTFLFVALCASLRSLCETAFNFFLKTKNLSFLLLKKRLFPHLKKRYLAPCMSDIIKLLPEHVANQIAAGEVIQRPASVVKELLENAIDAGGTQITLIIKEGGRTLIQVIDNGKGMSASDARMCWERHATSKIGTAEDIFDIRTMGFRGEALASIASVAQVELRTKRDEDTVATLIQIEASEVKKQEAVAGTTGTSITVKNLFYNIPARRNFLKSNPVETRHIIDEFLRVALARPDIGLTMHNNDAEVYNLPKGDLQKRIQDVFGYKSPEQVLPADEETSIIGVSGFIGKPENAKKTRGEQYFFVNKRFIKDAYLNHAVLSCYENLMPKDQFPFYVLHLEIDPAQIDVNVHPTKTEIKFEDERSIYQIVRAVAKKAIGQYYHVPTYEPASDDGFLNLSRFDRSLSNAQVGTKSSDPFTQNTFSKPAEKQDWQELFSVMNKQKDVVGKSFGQPRNEESRQTIMPSEVITRQVMQVHQSLIIAQIKSGILLVDQQAAHERVLYEKYLIALDQNPVASQQKLFPKTVILQPADEQLLTEMMTEIRALGFDINSFGKHTFAVNGVPAELNHYNEQDLIMQLIEGYKNQQGAALNKQEKVARVLAKRASTKSGTTLNNEEMNMLIDELFACKEPNYAPDGKVCLTTLNMQQLLELLNAK
jgi:DNA mismatch repair protein MutL